MGVLSHGRVSLWGSSIIQMSTLSQAREPISVSKVARDLDAKYPLHKQWKMVCVSVPLPRISAKPQIYWKINSFDQEPQLILPDFCQSVSELQAASRGQKT